MERLRFVVLRGSHQPTWCKTFEEAEKLAHGCARAGTHGSVKILKLVAEVEAEPVVTNTVRLE
jgi:hypothetical protein